MTMISRDIMLHQPCNLQAQDGHHTHVNCMGVQLYDDLMIINDFDTI